jgi:hypothetical protein
MHGEQKVKFNKQAFFAFSAFHSSFTIWEEALLCGFRKSPTVPEWTEFQNNL